MTNLLPKARTADIIEQEAGKELLIYDLRTNKMLQLNQTSKIVYLACGKISFDELKRKHQFPDDLIHLALAELKANDLLVDYQINHFAGLSRRDVIKRVGLATLVALPLISSLVAPSSANAASGFAPGSRAYNESCQTSTDCAPDAPNCRTVATSNVLSVPLVVRCCRNPNAYGASGFTSVDIRQTCNTCPATRGIECCGGGTDRLVRCDNNGNGTVSCVYTCP